MWCLLCLSAAAQAEMRLAVGGATGVTGARTVGTGSQSGVSADRKFGFGLGVLAEVPLVSFLSIEPGVFYLHRRFTVGNQNVSLSRTVPTLMFPVEARFWIGQVFSLSAGPFLAFGVGSPSDTVNVGPASASFSSGSRSAVELGATLAASLNFSTGKTGIFGEIRYNRGFSNASQDALFEERIDDILLMVGLRFGLGESDTPPPRRIEEAQYRVKN